jgi:hypothetical protein
LGRREGAAGRGRRGGAKTKREGKVDFLLPVGSPSSQSAHPLSPSFLSQRCVPRLLALPPSACPHRLPPLCGASGARDLPDCALLRRKGSRAPLGPLFPPSLALSRNPLAPRRPRPAARHRRPRTLCRAAGMTRPANGPDVGVRPAAERQERGAGRRNLWRFIRRAPRCRRAARLRARHRRTRTAHRMRGCVVQRMRGLTARNDTRGAGAHRSLSYSLTSPPSPLHPLLFPPSPQEHPPRTPWRTRTR